MLMRLAQRITSALFPDWDDEEQRTLCVYGCEIWLYTLLSTLGLLAIGAALGNGLEAAVMVAIFYLCQSNGGGFHASTHLKCFLTMTAGLLAGLALVRWPVIWPLLPSLCVVSLAILLAMPLRLHPHKQYLSENRRSLRMRSYAVTLGIALFDAALGLWAFGSLFRAAAAATFLSAVSRACANKDKSGCAEGRAL